VNVPFVDWKVDDDKRLIEVTVRLDVWLTENSRLFLNLLKQIFPAVEQKWSKKFKCYDFRLKIDWRQVPSLEEVRPNALDVRISDEMTQFGNTKAKGPKDIARACNSEDPKDQVVPERDPGNQSLKNTTSWPPAFSTISHEIGHVLGLDEGYFLDKAWYDFFSEGEPTPLPGHPDDVMQHPTSPVLPSTITKLLRRQFGRSLEERMHCPIALRSGPSELNLLVASLSDVRLDVKTDRYAPPTSDPQAPPEPSTFTGTFHAAGEYLAQLGLPVSASGELDRPVTFQLDLSREPIDLRIDLGFWVLTQKLAWDPVSSLPYAEGSLLIEAKGTTVDSSQFWPGPPLLADFYDPDREAPKS